MDLALSDEHRALAQTVRATCAKHLALDELRRREWSDDVVRPGEWQVLAEAGVFSLRVPGARGGLGLGLADAAVVFEELGRALVPGPLVATELAAALDIDNSSPAVGQPGPAPGVPAPGVPEAGVPEAGAPAPGMPVRAADGGAVVGTVRQGPTPVLVEHLPALDALVVVDDSRRELRVLDRQELAALAARPAGRSLDPLGPRWLAADPTAHRGRAIPGLYGSWCTGEQILTAALCAGIAAATCEMAVDYARRREQFGRPIGAFQAVKHLCADMLVRAETARAAVHAAAVTVDQPEVGDPVRPAAGAALVAGDAATANAKACLQVHGGVGFTWEVPVHLYLTRARALAAGLVPPGALARTVAERW